MSKIYFLVHLLLEGLQRSSGVLFLATREWLGCSRRWATIPFALNRVVSAVADVAFSYQKDRPRLQLGWGCFLSSAGVGLCFLATDVLWQTVFWGLIFGTGIGIATPLLLSVLTKKADGAILSSLRTVGPNIGCIILPFLLNELIFHYGLNGSYLILSAVILNCFPFILISTYEIKFNWLKKKWSLRTKSKRYRISKKENKVDSVSFYKQRDIKAFCNQSFTQNLEPDALEKVAESDDSPSIECIDILKPIIEAKIKMLEQRVCDREPFGLAKISQEDKNCYEEEFRSVKQTSNAQIESNCEKDSGLLEKGLSDLEKESDCTNALSNVNNKGEEINNDSASNSSTEQFEVIREEKTSETDKVVSEGTDSPPRIATLNKSFSVKKEFSPPFTKHGTHFPLEIKVHVVECTLTTTEECSNFLSKQEPAVNRNGYRRHSNSLITASFENIDFTQLLNNKASPLQKQQWNMASRMCLISEEDEDCSAFQRTVSECREAEVQTEGNSSSKVEALRALARPSCLAIMCSSVIYEFSLTVLLTIFSDFAEDTGDASVTSNIVLVSFGLGGVVGQLSFSQGGSRFLVEGSHAAAAVIFMLNGLAVAGVLWSINIAWLSGFYALLGFLESGVTKILPRLVVDYTEQKTVDLLSRTCKCLSTLAFLCIPCAIGQSRDVTGNYDGLLQMTSCLFVLCAVFCYFLPKWSGVQNRREQVEM
ncbi:uncharacterized protein TNIN_66821 [Trichonephila inaurata madagascariensis]|uniref:Uncharacterized protein n=1 Tax=Trichonephila inaurata madagascariensis TaxID=2747483 RepID=A0A8X6WZF1_9ARAC|nr:uncharacterized protein TNIN_66821 [Trichonephila inaurata madagascariensis]